jgi:peptidoglycan/LPS O-acetylase OafA/YrhL
MAASRLQVLDGWRGISISLVLLGHLFPLGPKHWEINSAIAASGMVIFFILSGFLITSLLLRDDHVGHFLIRRLMRIVPLAWVALVITLWWIGAGASTYVRDLLFVANWEPMAFTYATGHFWSLCVEVQFYVGIATIVLLLGKRGLLILPALGLVVTIFRIVEHKPIAINTYFRIDEILAGCSLALLYHLYHAYATRIFSKLSPLVMLPFLLLSSHDSGGFILYLRPYIAMLAVGSTRCSVFNRECLFGCYGAQRLDTLQRFHTLCM